MKINRCLKPPSLEMGQVLEAENLFILGMLQDAAKTLFPVGAGVNIVDPADKKALLHIATEAGHYQLVRYLLIPGAFPHASDQKDDTKAISLIIMQPSWATSISLLACWTVRSTHVVWRAFGWLR